MKNVLIILTLLIAPLLKAQEKESKLQNKTFSAYVGTGCEEVEIADSCAGFTTYLVLQFKEKTVSLIEKNISTCKKETIMLNFNYKWELTKDNILKIYSKPEDLRYSSFEGLTIEIKEGKIIGRKKTTQNDKLIKYQFIAS